MKFIKLLIWILLLTFLFSITKTNAQITKDAVTELYYDSHGKPYTGTYHEYDAEGTLIRTLLLLEGQFDGENTVFFANGLVKEIQSYKTGLMDGTWITYNANGIKTAQANYREGKKHGPWFIWNDQGNLMFEMYYEDGQRSGIWIKYARDGQVINSEEY